ncbi:PREDICTED: deoxyribose-phosphate aldolase [Polistes dominula]|uniref:deoxyribose-phosphate aldolase n=1 Tax=Polistes dominula TaxID=743375 RepID=A0ABM1IEZ2_POLDO|nr:PREDICTED: deoxyribose-phosphate aldolase [Polistes dominula]
MEKVSIKNVGEYDADLLDTSIDELEIEKKVKQIKEEAKSLSVTDKIATLLKAITFIDLTSLAGNDTTESIEKLCKRALNPLSGVKYDWDEPLHTAAVCVYPLRIQDAINALKNVETKHDVFVVTVAAGFPSGQYPLQTRLEEVNYTVHTEAKEIDVVINRTLALEQKWKQLYDELKFMRKSCYNKCMKTILSVGELSNYYNVYKASMVAMMVESDFIKTSTGKDIVNPTLHDGIVMCKAIKDYYTRTGKKVGFKPAGGIKTASDVLEWMTLVKQELGNSWLDKTLFRIGASSVLDNIANEIKNINDK